MTIDRQKEGIKWRCRSCRIAKMSTDRKQGGQRLDLSDSDRVLRRREQARLRTKRFRQRKKNEET